jgi:hypothetical protein
LWHARGGGRLSTGLAAVSAFGSVVDLVYPNPNPWAALRSKGLSYRHLSISGFIAKVLLIHTTPEMIAQDEDSRAVIWRTSDGTPAFGFYLGSGSSDLFLGPEGEKLLRELLQVIWDQGHELMITRTPTKDIIMTPMPALGPYIGKRQPGYYVKRLSKYGHGPRTILLRGPTGVGKSVLGRHISAGLGRQGAKTLKISSEVLKNCEEDEILAMVQWLRPTVLLLDDLDLDMSVYTSTFLALLEALRDPDCLVIVTMMTNHRLREKPPTRGAWHFPGMRPGRIEETFTLYLPDEDERKMILSHYFEEAGFPVKKKLVKRLAKATEGLSGAYLGAVVERVITHGVENWEEEVKHVLYMAPFPHEEDDEDSPHRGGRSEDGRSERR